MKNQHPKITVIVPAYNAEAHLAECINSVASQSLQDIEIVCVDDCSTDSTHEILLQLASSDERIRVLHHDVNAGRSRARNFGLDAATGEYVFYMDADDTLPPNALESLYSEAVVDGAEMVKGCMELVDLAGNSLGTNWPAIELKVAKTNLHDSALLRMTPGSHCTYLYRRKFLVEHNIRYPTDLVTGEDLVMLARALNHAHSVTLLPETVYYYRQTENSVTRGRVTARVALDSIKAKTAIADALREAGFPEDANNRLRTWRYDIEHYWLKMPRDLDVQEIYSVFSALRQVVSGLDIPWGHAPFTYKYLLSLVIAKRDQEAAAFLATAAVSNGFADDDELKQALEYILTVVPDDTETLLKLGAFASRAGELDRALDLFGRVLKINPNDVGANVECATVLRKQDKVAEAHAMLEETLVKRLDQLGKEGKTVLRIVRSRDTVYAKEKNNLKLLLAKGERESKSLAERLAQDLESARNEIKRLQKKLADDNDKHQATLEEARESKLLSAKLAEDLEFARNEVKRLQKNLADDNDKYQATVTELYLAHLESRSFQKKLYFSKTKGNAAQEELAAVRQLLGATRHELDATQQELGATQQELGSREIDSKNLQLELAAMKAKYASLQQDVDSLVLESKLAQKRFDDAQAENKTLRSELNAANKELDKEKNKLAIIYSSFTWKVTGPGRNLIGLLKRVL